ncbi:MAG: elongation factor P [Chloroflexi bacterium]|nr:elongation factor P [Chloroflexota bacterium]
MIDANGLRKGITFELDGNLYKVLDYSHHKPGRGLATIRIKARDMRSGATIDKTFSSSERVQDVRLDYHMVQYLYADGDNYIFMDNETFEQPAISAAVLGEATQYLTENIEVKLTFFENEPLDIELPTSVELKVTEAENAIKGDTATGLSKTVTTETGLQVQVPGFIEQGAVIKVDTRSGEYLTRV